MNSAITTDDEIAPTIHLFLNVLEESKKHDLGITTLNSFTKSLKQFLNNLKKSSDNAKISALKDIYYHDLMRVKYKLKSSKINELIGFHDKIYKDILGLDKQFPRGITIMFQDLIKGITFFSYQNDASNPMPMYHRIYSCGVGDESHRNQHLICKKTHPKIEIQRRRDITERCYIERKVYDELFKHEIVHYPETWNAEIGQDQGHQHRLKLTRDDFQTCFKNQEIDVELIYEETMPIKVRLIRKAKDKVLYEELYEKTIDIDSYGIKRYGEMVECTKRVGNKVYKKVQTFHHQTSYRLVRS